MKKRLFTKNNKLQNLSTWMIFIMWMGFSFIGNAQTKQLYLSDPSQALDRIDPVNTFDNSTVSTGSLTTTTKVTLDATSSTSVGKNVSSITRSHTTGTRNNRVMLVGVSFHAKDASDEITAVTYGGIALTSLGTQKNATDPDRGQVEIYSLVNPPAGTANVVVTFGGNLDKGGVLGVTTFTGAHQTSTFGPFKGNSGESTTGSITGIVSGSDELIFNVLSGRKITSATPNAGQTELWDVVSSEDAQGAASTKTGATSATIGWSMPASELWAMGAVSIKPAPVISPVTFTQNPVLCDNLTIVAGTITITNYVSITSGSMPTNPNITATLKYGANNIIAISNPTYSSGTGLLTWTGSLGADNTIPAGETIALEVATSETSAEFTIDYDSQTKPSKVEFTTSTYIDIIAYDVYDAPYLGGSIITNAGPSTTVYPRAVVSNPFGFDDITAMNITVTPSGTTVAATSVATSGCTRTYEYVWNTTGLNGTYSIPATAEEGFENTVTDIQALSFEVCGPEIGSPVFALGATSNRCQRAVNVTYTATSTDAESITYSLDAASEAASNSINTTTGEVTYDAAWTGTSTITVIATGCGGPKTTSHTVTTTPTVGTPVFDLGANSNRCQEANSVTYSATATNSTSINYSLDATSISGGNSINSTTGEVTYLATWIGTSTITVSAAGCNGPSSASHTVTTSSTVVAPTFNLGANSTRCDLTATYIYTATSPNTTGITYSLDMPSLDAGNTINAVTGEVAYDSLWLGTSIITASAAGCNGPATSTHSVTIDPDCAPVAADDSSYGTTAIPQVINVLTNDFDLNNNLDAASLTILTSSSNGSIQVGTGGEITYLPNGNYSGTDQFTYQVCDTGFPALCDNATVTITIEEIAGDPCAEATKNKTFYLPFAEDTDILRKALLSAASSDFLSNDVRTIVSLKAPYPTTIITYDHWEDGYEADIAIPEQSTTLIWGDGDLNNGVAPGYPTDVLPAGAYISIDNEFVYNPRDPSIIAFDGKDKVYSSADIAVSKVSGDAGTVGTNNVFDVQNLKTNVVDITRFGEYFVIPFGEDIVLGGTGAFKYTGVFMRAATDGTIVNLDYDGDNVIDETRTLNEGEVWLYDGTASTPGVAGNVNQANDIKAGATVTANFPVGVDLIFGGIDTYGTRNLALLPGQFYGNTYYTPVYTTLASAPVYVFFTNTLSNPITINWTAGDGTTGTVAVPANGTNYLDLPVAIAAGYKFENLGGESFSAVAIIDADADGSTYDWSFNLIPEIRLTDFTSIAWAPGSNNLSVNYNPVWVTPVANTTVYIKYDGDLTATPNMPLNACGLPYDLEIPLNALESYRVLDPDNDQSGLIVYTCDGVSIASVWGQDPNAGNPTSTGSPSQDVGYVMEPRCLQRLIIANDDAKSSLINTSITINVADNDDGFLTMIDTFSVVKIGLDSNGGILMNNGDGSFTYTPNPGFTGVDYFEYQICSVSDTTLCDVARVSISVSCQIPATGENDIIGSVFEDVDLDTLFNTGDSELSGITVILYEDINQDGLVDGGDTQIGTNDTDIDGNYSFSVTLPSSSLTVNYDDIPSGGVAINSGTSCTGTPISRTFTVTENLTITDINFGFNATHAYRGDIEIVLQSPLGTTATLIAGGNDADTNYDVWLDDASANSLDDANTDNTATPYYDRTANPANVLSIFNGENSVGTWTLTICDRFPSSDNGIYNRSQLQILGDEVVDVYYVLEIDQADLPIGAAMTTDNVETVVFSASDLSDCNNNFGVNLNYPPLAQNDSLTICANTTLSGDLFADNGKGIDTDPDGDSFTVNQVNGLPGNVGGQITLSSGAFLTVNSDGSFDYNPNGQFDSGGTETFTYQNNDGTTNGNTATVTITIYALPVLNITSSGTGICVSDTRQLTATPATGTFTILGTSTGAGLIDGSDILTVTAAGTLDVQYAYTNMNGCAVITTQTITINDNPACSITGNILVDGNSTGTTYTAPSGMASYLWSITGNGSINGANNLETVSINAEASGTFTLTLAITNNNNCSATCMQVVTINPIPTASLDRDTTPEDTPVNILVLLNDDFGVDGPSSTAIVTVQEPSNGSTAVNDNGSPNDPTDDTIDYAPNSNFFGLDSLVYQICDSNGDCDTALVIILVEPVNDPPIADNEVETTPEDTPIIIAVTLGDTDLDGKIDSTSITLVDTTSNGGVTINPITGDITYTPNLNFFGMDTLTYQVCDDGSPVLCDIAEVIITVVPVNDPPVADDEMATTNEVTPVLIPVTLGDTDIDGLIDSTSVALVDSTSNGAVSIDPITGDITYTPDGGFSGMDTLTYQVCDTGTPLPAKCDTAQVIITVNISVSNEIGLAKNAQSVVDNGDNTWTITYQLVVENLGDETLSNITLTDEISHSTGAFIGMNPTVHTVTSGTLLTANSSWDGAAATNILAGGQSLATGAKDTLLISVRVTPGATTSVDNQAMVTGTAPNTTLVTDLSDNGLVPDTDGDMVANESIAGGGDSDENDPTPTAFNCQVTRVSRITINQN